MTARKAEPKLKEPQPATVAKAPEAPKPMAATPTPTTPPQPPTVTKQSQTVTKLKEAWTTKSVDLSKLEEKVDGKYILLQPTPEWPIIRIGPTGGVELPQIRSYAKAWDAAVDGLAVWRKQQARDQKKATATPAPAQTTKPQPPAPSVKPETPAQKKAKEHRSLEAALA